MADTGTKPFEIREAGAGDVAAVARLWREEARFHEELAGAYRLRPDFDWQAFVTMIVAEDNHRVVVAEVGDEMVGFVFARIIAARGGPRRHSWLDRLRGRPAVGSPIDQACRGVIEDCFVRADHRRSGIARALARTAIEWFRQRGAERFELGVLANNPGAISFWQGLGFRTYRLQMARDPRDPEAS